MGDVKVDMTFTTPQQEAYRGFDVVTIHWGRTVVFGPGYLQAWGI